MVKTEKNQSKADKTLLNTSKHNVTPSKGQLPKAGSKNNNVFIVVGLAVIGLAVGIYALNRKKNND
ncbi:hypothetical protein RV09_GL001118 [Enterococcus moraviensis]|uniref:LPXTG cell wall anchor domain-containing protein n=1 Tax=Enterococcus moraviensis TaxID=155617 RepID=UPI0009004B72|nr:hypothetical protein RV09_GL001118 [Enterococcus moraviensis]